MYGRERIRKTYQTHLAKSKNLYYLLDKKRSLILFKTFEKEWSERK